MDPHYTYLMVDLGCLIGPLLLSFHPRLRFYTEWKSFIGPCLAAAALFLAWDALFTHLGVWGFNRDYVLGTFLFGMPLEEYLFFICIPFACTFSYHAFGVLFSFKGGSKFIRAIYALMILVLLAVGLTHVTRLYTGTTFLLLAVLLSVLLYRNASFLTQFICTFLFILIPFLGSNGILTGSFLGRVIVWYNNSENLGIRMLTIPVEDISYAMLLLMLNVWGFETLKQRSSRRTAAGALSPAGS